MPYCDHAVTVKRPLRIRGFAAPQMVCSACWARAIENADVDGHPKTH